MIARFPLGRTLPRAAALSALLAFGMGLGGCADMSDSMTSAFADPAKYDLYDCKQLEAERKSLAVREAELQGLMAKAQTGAGGAVVSELAYRNDYIALRGQARLADEVWQRNKCHPSPPVAAASPPASAASSIRPAPPASAKSSHPAGTSGSAVH
jgi:hypothetical protein